MRLAISAALVGVLFALVSPAADPPADALTKELIEADLKLVAKPAGDARVIEAGGQPHIEFALVNTSKTRTHKVVKPGDGSECGWRDPWVHLSAEQRGVDGKWAALDPRGYGRCGLYDSDWLKDVVELKPGAELSLKGWSAPPLFDFQYPGKVRVTGHYEYRAVGGKGGKARPDAERGAMAGVPLFAVRSEPVEFEVVRPLDVRVRVKKALKVGVEMKVSEVIEVTVTNTSNAPRTVRNLSQHECTAEVRLAAELATRPEFKDAPVYAAKKELKPGETVTLFGGGDFASTADGTWKGLKAGTTRVHFSYYPDVRNSGGRAIRAEAELRVE